VSLSSFMPALKSLSLRSPGVWCDVTRLSSLTSLTSLTLRDTESAYRDNISAPMSLIILTLDVTGPSKAMTDLRRLSHFTLEDGTCDDPNDATERLIASQVGSQMQDLTLQYGTCYDSYSYMDLRKLSSFTGLHSLTLRLAGAGVRGGECLVALCRLTQLRISVPVCDDMAMAIFSNCHHLVVVEIRILNAQMFGTQSSGQSTSQSSGQSDIQPTSQSDIQPTSHAQSDALVLPDDKLPPCEEQMQSLFNSLPGTVRCIHLWLLRYPVDSFIMVARQCANTLPNVNELIMMGGSVTHEYVGPGLRSKSVYCSFST
jgi:hypothetical protein